MVADDGAVLRALAKSMSSKARPIGKRKRQPLAQAARSVDDPVYRPNSVAFQIDARTDGSAVVLLLALASAYFFPILAAGNREILSAEGADVWSQYFYWRHFGFSALARGELPLWNPFIFSGTPYVAGIQSALFYPLNALYLVFGTAFATNLSVALHCGLASISTYAYARFMQLAMAPALLAGITFAYGAPYFLHIFAGHLSNLSTMAWLPLMFLAAEAFLTSKQLKYAVLGGLVLSMQVFAGHPQYVFYSLIAVTLYSLLSVVFAGARQDLSRCLTGFAVFIATGTACSAVQLFPALELTRNSVREALTYEWVSMFSLPPENLITLLLPDFFGNALTVGYWGKNYLWEMSLYVGLIPLAGAMTAAALDRSRPVKALLALAIASLLLAFGKYTPVSRILYGFVPGFDLFRGLSKFIFVFSFAIAMLAGYGLAKTTELVRSGDRKLMALSFSIFACAFGILLTGAGFYLYGETGMRSIVETVQRSQDIFAPPTRSAQFAVDALHQILRDAGKGWFFLSAFAGLLVAARKIKNFRAAHLNLLAVVLTVADLWLFGFRYLVTFDPARLWRDPELQAVLKQENEPFRVASPMFSMVNVGLVDGIENVGGYDAIVLKAYSDFISLSQGVSPDQPNIVMTTPRFSPMLRLLNVKYYLLESAMKFTGPDLIPIFENSRYKVYRDAQALPRSYIVHDVRGVQDQKAALRMMTDPTFSPESSAVIEEAFNNLPNDPFQRSPRPAIVKRSLNTVSIEASPAASGLLVLSDAYYPGWKAFVDGKESKIYRTNYVMRGVLLAPGSHRIEFRYDPSSFKIGGIVSITAFFMVIVSLVWKKKA
jgi:hypothetical protein